MCDVVPTVCIDSVAAVSYTHICHPHNTLGVREAVVLALIAASDLECVSTLSGSFYVCPCADCRFKTGKGGARWI